MNALEQFLDRATKGLRGQNRLEVREELEAHVLERAHKHELSGLARDLAIDQAVVELGHPETLAIKFQDVHMAKQKRAWFGAFAIMTVCAVSVWQASIPREFSFFCETPNQLVEMAGQAKSNWFERSSMIKDLEHFSSHNSGFSAYGVRTEFSNQVSKNQYFKQTATRAMLTLNERYWEDIKKPKKLSVTNFKLVEKYAESMPEPKLSCRIQ
jgi:hypothetical protein